MQIAYHCEEGGEGFILSLGAKLFTIARPARVYGLSASVVYGFLYWLWMLSV